MYVGVYVYMYIYMPIVCCVCVCNNGANCLEPKHYAHPLGRSAAWLPLVQWHRLYAVSDNRVQSRVAPDHVGCVHEDAWVAEQYSYNFWSFEIRDIFSFKRGNSRIALIRPAPWSRCCAGDEAVSVRRRSAGLSSKVVQLGDAWRCLWMIHLGLAIAFTYISA